MLNPNLRAQLYYKERKENARYSSQPNGCTPNLERLFQGRADYWRSINAGFRLAPKALILSDWTCDNWSPEKTKTMRALFQQLLTEGFLLYVWQDRSFHPLTKTNMGAFIPGSICHASVKKITQTAIKRLGRPSEQIRVLDDHQIHCLHNNQVMPRSLFMSDLACLDLEKEIELYAILKQAQPPLEAIICDESSFPAGCCLSSSESQFPSIASTIQYRHLKLDRPGDAVPENHQIEQLTLTSNARLQQIKPLPLLNRLVLQSINLSILNEASPDIPKLPRLETLEINYCDVQAGTLEALIDHSNNLKILKVIHIGQWNETIRIPVLPEIETLILNNVKISMENLLKLLRYSEKLQHLELRNNQFLHETMTNIPSLAGLETLILLGSNISIENLNILLERANNLARLDLSRCSNLPKDLSSLPALPRLEVLELQHYSNPINLPSLLGRVNNITTLDLSHCTNLHETMSNIPVLSRLTTLRLSRSNISPENLEALLSKTINIEKLDLSLCKALYRALPGIPNLTRLVTLNLSYSTISLECLIALLEKTGHLEEINLLHCSCIPNPPPEALQALLARIPVVKMDALHPGKPANKSSAASSPSSSSNRDSASTPQYNSENFRQFKPTPKDKPFQYTGLNQTKNQAMIVEKLSQYLTQTHQHTALIPWLQDGICIPLSRLFLATQLKQWQAFIEALVTWDARQACPPELAGHLDKLLAQVIEHKQGRISTGRYFPGDHILPWLKSHPGKYMLDDNWHVIVVQYDMALRAWHVYDPNDVDGMQTVSELKLDDLLRERLSSLITVWGPCSARPLIRDPSIFIRKGGLFMLRFASNAEDLLDHHVPEPAHIHPDALDGILLRDAQKGHPAWVWGLQSRNPRVQSYALGLLQAFISNKPTRYDEELQQSLELLSLAKRHRLIKQLIAMQPGFKHQAFNTIQTLCRLLRRDPKAIQRHEQALQARGKNKIFTGSISEYCQQLLQNPLNNQLIELNNREAVQAMQLHLQAYCLHTSREYFYINSPDDLICSAPFIRDGLLCKGPGGPLHDFLTAQHAHPPVLIVNYDAFETNDIVRLVSLVGNQRLADGTPLPDNLKLIGLIDPHKPDCYQGSDFYTGFGKKGVHTCPFHSSRLMAAKTPLPLFDEPEASQDYAHIDLYNAPDWKERLLGRWLVDGQRFHFEEGLLARAMSKGLPLMIHNGPWDDPNFKAFWEEGFLRKQFNIDGQKHPLPANFKLVRQRGYDWDKLRQRLQYSVGYEPDAGILNPLTLNHWFRQFQCDNATQRMNLKPGLLAEHAGRQVHLNLTRSLTEDELAMLLSGCEEYDVRLHLHLLPGTNLPERVGCGPGPTRSYTKTTSLSQDQASSSSASTPGNNEVIQSNDCDSTLALLTQTPGEWLVFHISECGEGDLLKRLNTHFNPQTLTTRFNEQEAALLQALKAGKKVILTGQFTDDLADALTPLLLHRRQHPEEPGALLLLSDDTGNLACLEPVLHPVDKTMKARLLGVEPHLSTLTDTQWKEESLSQLNTRLTQDDPWQGMENCPPVRPDTFNPEQSQQNNADFHAHRWQGIDERLANSPYVFITGLTGVGKTTSIEQYAASKANCRLHRGDDAVENWAADQGKGLKLLVIDEANLSPSQRTAFEGLYNKPPGILINGRYDLLSAEHKIIFAGNPLSYAGGRQLAPFFKRHGQALLFEPLPQDVIYESVLKPILQDSLSGQTEAVARIFLEVYAFLREQSDQTVLVSPREVQTMAQLFIADRDKYPQQDPLILAKELAFQVGRTLAPEHLSKQFNQRFQPDINQQRPAPERLGNKLLPNTQKDLVNMLDSMLNLQSWRQAHQFDANSMQLYGGLGGVVLEGRPGNDINETLVALLLERGYQEAHLHQQHHIAKPFYRLPVSMQTEDKKRLLLKAFHEGAIVLIDNLNSDPMMEAFLNDLLMGKNPEAQNSESIHPDKPGFMIFATQSPFVMGGRIKSSEAIDRRMLKIQVQEPDKTDLLAMLTDQGLDQENANDLATAYSNLLQKNAAPPLKELWSLAEEVLLRQNNHTLARSRFFQTKAGKVMPAISSSPGP